MDSQQLVETTSSQNSQDIVLPKPPANLIPRHSIDAILGRAGRKRTHDEIEQSSRDAQENTGNATIIIELYDDHKESSKFQITRTSHSLISLCLICQHRYIKPTAGVSRRPRDTFELALSISIFELEIN